MLFFLLFELILDVIIFYWTMKKWMYIGCKPDCVWALTQFWVLSSNISMTKRQNQSFVHMVGNLVGLSMHPSMVEIFMCSSANENKNNCSKSFTWTLYITFLRASPFDILHFLKIELCKNALLRTKKTLFLKLRFDHKIIYHFFRVEDEPNTCSNFIWKLIVW